MSETRQDMQKNFKHKELKSSPYRRAIHKEAQCNGNMTQNTTNQEKNQPKLMGKSIFQSCTIVIKINSETKQKSGRVGRRRRRRKRIENKELTTAIKFQTLQ